MGSSIQRREFLTGSMAAVAGAAAASKLAWSAEPSSQQEFYELRKYLIQTADRQAIVSQYLQQALLPALGRMGLDRIGVFTVLEDAEDLTIFTLIPYPNLQLLAERNDRLAADSRYQEAARPLFELPKNEPAYVRIESRLMKAFAGMPVLQPPPETAAGKPRIFELRIYESHNEEMARRKVEMFNTGEIELMRQVHLGPVLYGETLISNDVPNLTYMLSASDMEAHKAHWQAFLQHPEWKRMKGLQRYKGTVSKITNWFLQPTAYSQL